jgi:hypothetical protein
MGSNPYAAEIGEPGTLAKPLFHRTEYNLAAGTQVRITLKNGNIYEGKVLINPSKTKSPSTIELRDVCDKNTGRKAGSTFFNDSEIETGWMTLRTRDYEKGNANFGLIFKFGLVEVLQAAETIKGNIQEFNLPTVLVNSEETLFNFVSTS